MAAGDFQLSVRTTIADGILDTCTAGSLPVPEIKYFVPAYDPAVLIWEGDDLIGVTNPSKDVSAIANRIDPITDPVDPDFVGHLKEGFVTRIPPDGDIPSRLRVRIDKRIDEYNISAQANVFYVLDENMDIWFVIHVTPHTFAVGQKWEIVIDCVVDSATIFNIPEAAPHDWQTAVETLLPEVIIGSNDDKTVNGKAGYDVDDFENPSLDIAGKRVLFLEGIEALSVDTVKNCTGAEFSLETPNTVLDLANARLTLIGDNLRGHIRVINADNNELIITGNNLFLDIESDNDNCLNLTCTDGAVKHNGKLVVSCDAEIPENRLFRQGGLTQIVTSLFGVQDTDAHQYEIGRVGYGGEWAHVGVLDIELYESFFESGVKKKYSISYGYNTSGSIQLVEMTGEGTNRFQVTLGDPVLIEGNLYYRSIYVKTRSYAQCIAVINTNRPFATTEIPNTGEFWWFESPTANSIPGFIPDSTVYLRAGSRVDNPRINEDVELTVTSTRLNQAPTTSEMSTAIAVTDDKISSSASSGNRALSDSEVDALIKVTDDKISSSASSGNRALSDSEVDALIKVTDDKISSSASSANRAPAISEVLALNPIGVMKMFDGTNWTDNSTIPGWYACIPGNATQAFADAHNGVKCPNLVDRFVMGKVISGASATGGANSTTLTTTQLPAHTHTTPSHNHTINHDHGASSMSNPTGSANHYHQTVSSTTVTGSSPTPSSSNYIARSGWTSIENDSRYSMVGTPSAASVGRSNSSGASHSHVTTATVTNYTDSSGDASPTTNSSGTGAPYDSRPAFYSLIFIKRVA